jgi:hypothetical protein
MGYIDAVNPFTLTINELAERWATNKTQEILDRTAEFCDKDCTKEVAMLTLRAWYDCEDLRSAARHLGAGVDVQPPDALTLIVNTVYAAQNIEHDPSCRCADCESTKIDAEWDRFSDTATESEMSEFVAEMEAR